MVVITSSAVPEGLARVCSSPHWRCISKDRKNCSRVGHQRVGDRRLHLYFRVHVRQIRRRGLGTNRGEAVRLAIRPRLAQALQNRGELLFRNPPDRELGSGGAIKYSDFRTRISVALCSSRAFRLGMDWFLSQYTL